MFADQHLGRDVDQQLLQRRNDGLGFPAQPSGKSPLQHNVRDILHRDGASQLRGQRRQRPVHVEDLPRQAPLEVEKKALQERGVLVSGRWGGPENGEGTLHLPADDLTW